MEEQIVVMIVEDDEILSREIGAFLEKWEYKICMVTDFAHVTEDVLKWHPHLILLDVTLPFYDGFYWCQKIREKSEVPIIFISSRADDRDKIMGIAQGGDDYVEKPFQLELLKAKMEAILRRTYRYKVKDRIFINENINFETNTGILRFKEAEVELTKSERQIVTKLMKERPEVVTRENLMRVLWNTDEFVSDSTLTTMISRLRTKIITGCGQDLIQTKKGQGYYIL